MSDKSILFRMESTGGSAPRLRLQALAGDESVPDAGGADRYERVGEIARGGVGVVYKGRDVDLGRDVAMKVLRERHVESPEIVQRFVEEAQIGGQLQHPGIVPVYELGLDAEERPFFAMKLVKGETLAALLDGRQEIGEERRKVLAVFEAACRTVAYAHSRGVVHRDLKPANVMIGAFGEVQVVDWGFAKVLARGGVADESRSRKSKVDLTRIETVRSGEDGSGSIAGSVFGTPSYMPPEQALGHVEELDERSDVFALGAILCEILTGDPPYTGETRDAFRKAARCDLDDAHKRLAASNADAEMVELCRQALSPVPKDRPRNAAQIAEVVSSHLSAAEERAHLSNVRAMEERERAARSRRQAEDARAKAEDQQRRRRRTIGIAAAMLVVLLLGGGAWFALDRERNRQRKLVAAVEEAMQEATRLQGAGELDGALAAAIRAGELAGPEAPEDLRAQAVDLLEQVRADHSAARAAAARRAEDEAFVAELAEIHFRHSQEFDSVATVEDYVSAFRARGIDLQTLSEAEAVEAIRARTDPLSLAAALDSWAGLHLRAKELPVEEARRLLSIAGAVDADDWRNRTRNAVLANDFEMLREFAREADLGTLPVRTLVSLGTALGREDPEQGLSFFRRAHLHHPGELWINYGVAWHAGKAEPPLLAERIRFLTASIAVSPESGMLRALLGRDYGRVGRPERARAELARALELASDSARVHSNVACFMREMGMIEESEAVLRRGIELDPGYHLLWANLAAALQDLERYDESLDAALTGLKLKPDDPLLLLNKGVALSFLGRHDEAFEVFRRARGLDPDEVLVHANLGATLHHLGRTEEALAAFRRAAELGPLKLKGATGMAACLNQLRKWDEAIDVLRRSIESSAGSSKPKELSNAYNTLGNALAGKNQLEAAVAEYRRAIDLDPGQEFVHTNMGNALRKLGRTDEAIKAFHRDMELYPDSAEPHIGLGATYSDHLDDQDRAEKAFREAIRLESGNPFAWFNLGQVLMKKGKPGDAIACFEKARELDPAYYRAWCNLGHLQYQEGDYEAAAASMLRAMQLARSEEERTALRRNAGTAVLAGVSALESAGDHRGSLETLRGALDSLPADPRILNNLAWQLVACPVESLRDPDEALRHARKAAEKEPDNPYILGTLGTALYRVGLYEEAVLRLMKAIPLCDDVSAVIVDRLVLAMALQMLDRKTAAREALRAAVESIPETTPRLETIRMFRAEAEALILGEGR